MNNTFPDGNKRTATISLLVFLLNNGYDLNATDEEIVKFALRIARGYERNLYAIKPWIKRRMVKINEQKNNVSHKLVWKVFKGLMDYFNSDSSDK